MKTRLLSLAFIGAMAFTSCQSDVSSENPEEINEIQNAQKEKTHDVNKWHRMEGEPPTGGGSILTDAEKLHQPNYFQGALANCDTYAHYEGGDNLMVIQNEPQSYHGEVDVNTITVNDQLNICGTSTVFKNVNVNYGGIFNFGGEMITEGNMKVNLNGHLVIEGNMIIKGDLILNNGSLVKFLGENSSIEVMGDAKIHKNAIIEGEFIDVSNKIK